MGCYVNPTNESKETWLEREGKRVNAINWNIKPLDTLPVVLMNSGPFTAAGVAYSESELKAFTQPSDNRSKIYYYVSIEKLSKVSPILDYLNK